MTFDITTATTMRAQGKSYREIGAAMGVSANAAFFWFQRHAPDFMATQGIGALDSAAELSTWAEARGEYHLHRHGRSGQRTWYVVERTTTKCNTRRCLRVPVASHQPEAVRYR